MHLMDSNNPTVQNLRTQCDKMLSTIKELKDRNKQICGADQSKGTIAGLYDLSHRLPISPSLGVVGNAIQDLQFYEETLNSAKDAFAMLISLADEEALSESGIRDTQLYHFLTKTKE